MPASTINIPGTWAMYVCSIYLPVHHICGTLLSHAGCVIVAGYTRPLRGFYLWHPRAERSGQEIHVTLFISISRFISDIVFQFGREFIYQDLSGWGFNN